MSGDVIETQGTVERVSRGDLYSIAIVQGAWRRTVSARRSARLTKHNIKIVEGDTVLVKVSPYDLGRGRITRRL